MGLACQPKCRERKPRHASSQFPQGGAAGNGLGQAPGKLIELIVHNVVLIIGPGFSLVLC
jgi:hypothetical protein